MSLNHDEKLNLKKIMDETDYVDNTHNIRRLKHSKMIRDNVKRIEELKREHEAMRLTHIEGFFSIVQEECRFLYDNYTDIFNRLVKDELDIPLMYQMLETLKKIEDGKIDQQEGSVVIGKILHKIFVESALKHRDNVELSLADKGNHEDEDEVEKNEGKNIDWTTFKKQKLAQSNK